MSEVTRITDRLEKPELDDRSYRVIKLGNQLEALLVHDPDTDKASASANVNVGNFSDEEAMPGMAHAVEVSLRGKIYRWCKGNTYQF
jgi:insulysin